MHHWWVYKLVTIFQTFANLNWWNNQTNPQRCLGIIDNKLPPKKMLHSSTRIKYYVVTKKKKFGADPIYTWKYSHKNFSQAEMWKYDSTSI